MPERPDGLPPPADSRDIVDNSGPIPGRLAGWAQGEPVLGKCPACGKWEENVGLHDGQHKECFKCFKAGGGADGRAPVSWNNPLNL